MKTQATLRRTSQYRGRNATYTIDRTPVNQESVSHIARRKRLMYRCKKTQIPVYASSIKKAANLLGVKTTGVKRVRA